MRTAIAPAVLALALPLISIAGSPVSRPAPPAIPGEARAVPADPAARIDPNVFRLGPVRAEDPVTRARIEGLYREQFDLRQDTMSRLQELGEAAKAASDPDALRAFHEEGMQLKRDLELRNMELGLEIARLNGDEQRAAEFEEALDQLRHPEKWMPVHQPDPELQARRLRELGITE
ncbi:MAG: hypothetical protein ACT4PE_00715 [Candidatus Eiseniibacteriota bacterium]